MEVLGSVSAVVQVVILLADKVLDNVSERAKKRGSRENVKQLKDWLSQFQSFVRDQESKPQQSRVSRDLVKRVVDLTADIEDALDEFMFAAPIHFHNDRATQMLSDAMHRGTDIIPVRKLESQRAKIQRKIEGLDLTHHVRFTVVEGFHEGLSRRPGGPLSQEQVEMREIVGFTKHMEDLLRQLTGGPQTTRSTIQVAGSGCSGKTLLVKRVYNCLETWSHFQCMAWIDMPCGRDLWDELSSQMISPRDRQILDGPGIAKQKLERYLADKRYLVVLDNVWKRQEYTAIVNPLPNNYCGSKIIIITRNSGVADSPNYSLKLDGLTKEEAWKLFCLRAFEDKPGNVCPANLKSISEKILLRCEGLPLAVAAVGSLLLQKGLVEREWEKFHDSLGSELGSNSNLPIVDRILQPSFFDLPDHLRSCFLYFSMFPEDEPVSHGRLIRSWMAEGFLTETGGKTPEEVAGSYLDELIQRSLVRVCELDSHGRVRKCQVPRLHHMFIVSLSAEGRFITVIDSKSGQQNIAEKALRRVSDQSDNFPTKLSQVSDLTRVRALFVFGKLTVPPESNSIRSRLRRRFKKLWSKDELEKVFLKLRLLKVLDLQGLPIQQLPSHVGSYELLRSLNLRDTELETIPSSIDNLFHLETLDLKRTRVKSLPDWIIKLRNLRHLVVSWLDSSENEQGVNVSPASIGALSSLQRLSLIKATCRRGFNIEEFGSLVELKKFGMVDIDENCSEKVCNAIEKMVNLSKLDVSSAVDKYLALDRMENSPKIRCLNLKGLLRRLPHWITGLHESLVKVVLKGSKLNQNPFEGLEDLQSLMELQMVESYTGKSLIFRAGKFQSLKKLHVEQLDFLTEVVVERAALIELENLTVCKCKRLNPLPRIYPLGRLVDVLVYDMSEEFIADINQRMTEGDLVDRIEDRSSGELQWRRRRFT